MISSKMPIQRSKINSNNIIHIVLLHGCKLVVAAAEDLVRKSLMAMRMKQIIVKGF